MPRGRACRLFVAACDLPARWRPVKHRPRKRFGQHFLVDPGVIDAIVHAIAPQPGQMLVEIGPGLGALTIPLARHAGRLTVIELDRDLARRLRAEPHLRVLQGDVLRLDFKALARELGGSLRVCGNLPYNVSTPLLFHLLPVADCVRDQHFMLQKEVVERMVAPPGTRDYGRLSVMLQWRYDMGRLLDVSPDAFDPPPRVDSAVVRMVPRRDPAPVDPALLSAIVKVAFSQRRKLLRHTLGKWLAARDARADFNVRRRAEEVPVAEYVALAQSLVPVSGH